MRAPKGPWLVWPMVVALLASAAYAAAPEPERLREPGNPGGAGSESEDHGSDEGTLVSHTLSLFKQPGPSMALRSEGLGKCGTPLMLELEGRWTSLSAESQAALSALPVAPMARGLSPEESAPVLSGSPERLDTAHFRIRYALEGHDAVPPLDEDHNGVPDYVDAVAAALEDSHAAEVERLAWLEPPLANPYDPANARYNVYLLDISVAGLASGYAQTYWNGYAGDNEHSLGVVERYAAYSYIVLENDELSVDLIRVTAAHEYCHAIQLGYNGDVNGWDSRRWLMESTAAWMEDEVFDAVNDNVRYLRDLLDSPDVSLTAESHWYSGWLFARYIAEHYGGPDAIRSVWELGAQMSGNWAFEALVDALGGRGATVGAAFADFAVANLVWLPCDAAPGPYCYREALLYRDMAGTPDIEGVVHVVGSEAVYFPPDGVQPLGADYILVSVTALVVKVGVYGSDSDATYQGRLVAAAPAAARVWTIVINRASGEPDVAVSLASDEVLYLVVANGSAPTRMDSSGYGAAFVATDASTATPTPTITATCQPGHTCTAVPTVTATPTGPPLLARQKFLPMVAR